jgi:hypothetical protein
VSTHLALERRRVGALELGLELARDVEAERRERLHAQLLDQRPAVVLDDLQEEHLRVPATRHEQRERACRMRE